MLAAGERMAVVIERVLGTVTETGEPDWPAGEDAVTTWRALRVRGTGDTSG